MVYIKFNGLVTYQTTKGRNVKLSITDEETCATLARVITTGRTPFSKDTYQIVLTPTTKITSEIGREDIECLPEVVGWRVTCKLKVKKYSFKSTWAENLGELVEGCTLVATEIHMGS